MAISKEKKTEILNKLQDIFKKAKSVVFVNFHGLTVGDETAMRKSLTAQNINYYVAKKTLIKRVLEEGSISGELPVLDGELALAYGDDLVVPAREVHGFTKKHKGNLAILGGVFEKKFMNMDEMNDIATIPPLEVLYGQIVNVINSPIQGLVMSLDQIAKKKEVSVS